MMSDQRWVEVTRSQHAHEAMALKYLRERLPDHEPYRAWSNFSFVADNGNVFEIDLLVISRFGVFLVEIKSLHGGLIIDNQRWYHARPNGRHETIDSPLKLLQTKAQHLKSQLLHTGELRRDDRFWLEHLVFLSEPDLDVELRGTGARVVFPEGMPGGLACAATVLTTGQGVGLRGNTVIETSAAKRLARAIEAVVRPIDRSRRVGEYRLDEELEAGPTYRDFLGVHRSLGDRRRVRVYGVTRGGDADARNRVKAAAAREFELLESMRSESILAVLGRDELPEGPVLLFEHPEPCARLDHFLAAHPNLAFADRLALLRQLSDAVVYAHRKRIVHRALSPASVLVTGSPPFDEVEPAIRVFNWSAGAAGEERAGTRHVPEHVIDESHVYLAPEAHDGAHAHVEMDVFGLGALAYRLLAGVAPAATVPELFERLLTHGGLRPSQQVDGLGPEYDRLVFDATQLDPTRRTASSALFARQLDAAVQATGRTFSRHYPDPLDGHPGDWLEHDLEVVRRLGRGSTAVALQVVREGREAVLKVARDPASNARLRAEAEALRRIDHELVVALHEVLEFRGVGQDGAPIERVGLLLQPAGEMTLSDRLREQAPLPLDELRRLGGDLLEAVGALEAAGVDHRDIKPDNLGVGESRRDRRMRLMLFDFSLASARLDDVRVGTAGYRDPFLVERGRWDVAAERYSAAVTLFEMATGALPMWGDGRSGLVVPPDAELRLDTGLELASDVRQGLLGFFRRGMARDVSERFGNAEEMRAAWDAVFETQIGDARSGEGKQELLLETARPETLVSTLGLEPAALDALDRMGVVTVADWLSRPPQSVTFQRGVGARVRRQLGEVLTQLAARLPDLRSARTTTLEWDDDELGSRDYDGVPIDALLEHIVERSKLRSEDRERVRTLLRLEAGEAGWPGHGDIERACAGAGSGWFESLRQQWSRKQALAPFRDLLFRIVDDLGGVVTAESLAYEALVRRGSASTGERRLREAIAVVWVAVQAELRDRAPRLATQRVGPSAFVGISDRILEPVYELATVAERLASEYPPCSRARTASELSRVVVGTELASYPPERLATLAAAAVEGVSVSSRSELYRRGLDGTKAVRLVAGVLASVPELSSEDVASAVRSRYPDAAPVPAPQLLAQELSAIGLPHRWDEERRLFVAERVGALRLTRATSTGTAPPDVARRAATSWAGSETPSDERLLRFAALDDKLARPETQRGFLALLADPADALVLEHTLGAAYGRTVMSLDAVILEELEAIATSKRVSWTAVLEADAPGDPNVGRLRQLVALAWPQVEARILQATEPLVLVHPGLLARFERMDLLDRLRDLAGTRQGPPGVWIVVPGDRQRELPAIDGATIPTINPSERVHVPRGWTPSTTRAA